MQDSSRWKMVAVSVALHATVGTLLWLLPARLMQRADEPEPIDIVFYSPDEVKPAPPPPEPLIADNEIPEILPEAVIDIPVPAPIVRNDPPPVPVRPETRPPEPVVARVKLPEPKPTPKPTPKPAPKPKVHTDVFAKNQPAPKPTRNRINPAVATIGAFTTESTAEPIGRADTRVVSAASFGGSATSVPAQGKSAPRQVATTGFAGQVAVQASGPSTSGSVKQGGFGDGVVAAKKTTARRGPTANPDQPVEVLSKVKPIYTDEARQMRIEGEVVLEVTFVASGRLRVLRVVGGLGHGLDEAAIVAAEKIQFKPARRDGRPVDHTATLRVVFRLA